MRRRPDHHRRGLGLVAASAAVLLAAGTGPAAPALAQVGIGAERYEVTITPPKRPGSRPEPAAGSTEAPAAGFMEAPAAGSTEAPAAGPVQAPAAGADAGSAEASAKEAPAAPARTARAAPAQDLPLRTLQVGAYRHRAGADDLREKLERSFPDVSVVEVQSGGEPLYRVIVGRLPKGSALEDLRSRLAAAGHAAFDVPAPPPARD